MNTEQNIILWLTCVAPFIVPIDLNTALAHLNLGGWGGG